MKGIYRVEGLGVMKSGKALLEGVSLELGVGELVCVLGPNGAGKSTLLRVLAGLEPTSAGTVELAGKNVTGIGRRAMARQVALVEAMVDLPFGYSVEQVVMMGRNPHVERWFEASEDLQRVEQAMGVMDCLNFRHRDFRTLSSGEKQRVLVASALAQQSCVLLLDEPAAFLDVQHQQELFRALRRLTERGYLVVAVTHDWNLAAAWATKLVLLEGGKLRAVGTAAELSKPELLRDVFQVPLEVLEVEGRAPVVLQPGEKQ